MKKRMSDAHLSCLAAIPKMLSVSHGNFTSFIMNGVKLSRVTAQKASGATSAEHVTTENCDQQKGEFIGLCSYMLFCRVMNMTCSYSVLSSVVYKT